MADFSTVARPYARAVFDVAEAEGNLSGWSEALAAAAGIVSDAAAREYLALPGLAGNERADFVAGICEGMDEARFLASGAGRHLLGLLGENDRLAALPEIAAQFEALKSAAENKIAVTLVSASEVEEGVARSVADSLRRKLGRDVELTLEVDSSLLGGAIVKAEDMVIDGSVRSRLQRLAESLID